MPRKFLVYAVLAAFVVEAVGCTSKKPVIRGQSPEIRTVFHRLRRDARATMEPVREVTKKGLALGGALAIVVGSWFVQSAIDDLGDPSVGGNDNPRASHRPAASSRSEATHQDQDHGRRRTDQQESDPKDEPARSGSHIGSMSG